MEIKGFKYTNTDLAILNSYLNEDYVRQLNNKNFYLINLYDGIDRSYGVRCDGVYVTAVNNIRKENLFSEWRQRGIKFERYDEKSTFTKVMEVQKYGRVEENTHDYYFLKFIPNYEDNKVKAVEYSTSIHGCFLSTLLEAWSDKPRRRGNTGIEHDLLFKIDGITKSVALSSSQLSYHQKLHLSSGGIKISISPILTEILGVKSKMTTNYIFLPLSHINYTIDYFANTFNEIEVRNDIRLKF